MTEISLPVVTRSTHPDQKALVDEIQLIDPPAGRPGNMTIMCWTGDHFVHPLYAHWTHWRYWETVQDQPALGTESSICRKERSGRQTRKHRHCLTAQGDTRNPLSLHRAWLESWVISLSNIPSLQRRRRVRPENTLLSHRSRMFS